MDDKTAQILSRLTGEFYQKTAESFSATRNAPWQGWQRVVERAELPSADVPFRVLDLACGNLRFERFLAESLPGCAIDAWTFDACDELVFSGCAPDVTVHHQNLDVTAELFAGSDLSAILSQCRCDISVCFGFMHHVALPRHREQILEALVGAVRPGGLVALSFWQLSQSDRLLAKAQAMTEHATRELGLTGLGPGDYLLGWQDRTDVLRYCHDFSESELDELSAMVSSKVQEIARFSADGKEGNLNRYLLLKRA